jgi:isopentenyl diphosphate isomerase/L-lactate dehydrogenase-like FMN-dependent dehydrogenase
MAALPPDLLSLADYARLAREFMEPPVLAWLEGGSGGEQAVAANRSAFDRLTVYNRLLVDCRHGTTRTELLGHAMAHPILLAPIGLQRLVHPEGEVASARGALDTTMVVSTLASCPVEAIAAEAAGALWFQLYLQPSRDHTLALVRRAEQAGCRAIVVTLDTPIQPLSHATQMAGFALPGDVGPVHLGFDAPVPVALPGGASRIFRGLMASAPSLDDLRWLRSATALPLVAKGVTHAGDARMLIDEGCDGLVVSNHGGRALDAAPSAIEALPAIREALGPGAVLLVDGGIRSGSDVFKAIALGADAVMIGRPQIHALAVAGDLGVAHMLRLLREELEVVMALAGCPTLADISGGALFRGHLSC